MNPDDASPSEDHVTQFLVTYDQALARGGLPPEPSPHDTPSELRPRLRRGMAGVRLLRQVLSRPAPGAAFAQPGRYRIQRELGRGASGLVFLARDTQLHRD